MKRVGGHRPGELLEIGKLVVIRLGACWTRERDAPKPLLLSSDLMDPVVDLTFPGLEEPGLFCMEEVFGPSAGQIAFIPEAALTDLP
jgi:hypothetical protein